MSVYTREKRKWFSFFKSIQPWSVICQHCRGLSILDRTGRFQGMEWDVTGHWRMTPFPFELKSNLCSQMWVWVRSKEVLYFRWETCVLNAYGLQRFYGTGLKEMVFPCLNCFGIRHCRCSVSLCFSFHTNLSSVLVWKMEYVLLFLLLPIMYYYFLLPTTKKLFWSFGPFLVHWMLMDDMYICSRALPMQIAYESWGCSNQTWLKVIEI